MLSSLIEVLTVVILLATPLVDANPMYRSGLSSRKGKEQVDEYGSFSHEGHSSPLAYPVSPKHGTKTLQDEGSVVHHNLQSHVLGELQNLDMTYPTFHPDLPSTLSQHEWANFHQQHWQNPQHQVEVTNNHFYERPVRSLWDLGKEGMDQGTSSLQHFSVSDHNTMNRQHEDTHYFNPFDGSILGGKSSSLWPVWDEVGSSPLSRVKHHKTSSSHEGDDDKEVQELENHLFPPPREPNLNHPLTPLIPLNSVFDVEELPLSITLDHLLIAQNMAHKYPPGSLRSQQRAEQRRSLRNRGVPLPLKYNKIKSQEEKDAMLERYRLKRKAKRMERRLAKELAVETLEGASQKAPERQRLGLPPEGVTKEAYRHIYISQDKIDKLNEVQKEWLHNFYAKYPLDGTLEELHSAKRHTFYNDRNKLIQMGIPLPEPTRGRPLLDEAEAKEAEKRNKLSSRYDERELAKERKAKLKQQS